MCVCVAESVRATRRRKEGKKRQSMMDEAFRRGGEIEPGQVGAERTVAPAAAVAIPSLLLLLLLLFCSFFLFFSFLAASATEIV